MSTTASTTSASTLRTLAEYQSESSSSGSELDKDAFLSILVAQLTYQNPLDTSSDTEFVAQLAQFTMLEQLENLNDATSTQQSYDYVGQYVYIEDSNNSSSIVFGKVDGVVKQNGIDYVVIGDSQYYASDVIGVVDSSLYESTDDTNILESANLIGKTVTAEYTDENGDAQTITGVVDKITIEDGVIYAYVGDQQLLVSDITEISE